MTEGPRESLGCLDIEIAVVVGMIVTFSATTSPSFAVRRVFQLVVLDAIFIGRHVVFLLLGHPIKNLYLDVFAVNRGAIAQQSNAVDHHRAAAAYKTWYTRTTSSNVGLDPYRSYRRCPKENLPVQVWYYGYY